MQRFVSCGCFNGIITKFNIAAYGQSKGLCPNFENDEGCVKYVN
jgi:hypothetical protein